MRGLNLSELAEKLRAKGLLPEVESQEHSKLLPNGAYSNWVASPGMTMYYFDTPEPMFPLVK